MEIEPIDEIDIQYSVLENLVILSTVNLVDLIVFFNEGYRLLQTLFKTTTKTTLFYLIFSFKSNLIDKTNQ